MKKKGLLALSTMLVFRFRMCNFKVSPKSAFSLIHYNPLLCEIEEMRTFERTEWFYICWTKEDSERMRDGAQSSMSVREISWFVLMNLWSADLCWWMIPRGAWRCPSARRRYSFCTSFVTVSLVINFLVLRIDGIGIVVCYCYHCYHHYHIRV